MKPTALKSKVLLGLSILVISVFTSSCVVSTHTTIRGPKGWFKNSNNPHHPKSTNPGHNKDKEKKGKKDEKKHHHTFEVMGVN